MKEGNVRYEIAYLDSDGRQRWQTVASLRDARQLRADLVSKVGRGERVAPSRTTVADYAETWLANQRPRLRPGTFALYESHLRTHINPRLGRRRVQDLTVSDVARLIGEMQSERRVVGKTERQGYAAPTIRAVVNVLNRLLATAERDGLVTANPVRKLEKRERPQSERREFPSLTKEDVGRLVRAAPERYRALVALSIVTGLRQSEALGLRWQDLDIREGVIRVRSQLDRSGTCAEPKTKNAKRDIPITSAVARMLAEHRLASRFSADGDFVFASEAGTPLHHRNLSRRALEPALRTAGLPHLRWHDLRHVAASAMIAEGMSDHDIARVLGHANAVITKTTYAHQFEKAQGTERTREGMEAAFAEVLR